MTWHLFFPILPKLFSLSFAENVLFHTTVVLCSENAPLFFLYIHMLSNVDRAFSPAFSNRNMYSGYCKSNSIWDSDEITCVYSLSAV